MLRLPDVGILALLGATLTGCTRNEPAQVDRQTPPSIERIWSYNHVGDDGSAFALGSGDIDPSDEAHELVVGQPFYGDRSGRVLYFADLEDSIPDLILPNPRGTNFRSLFGAAVSVGDVNGDGASDILVGERTWHAWGTAGSSGRAVLYLGRPGGGLPDTIPALVLHNPDPGSDGELDNFADHVHIARLSEGDDARGIRVGERHARILVGARNQDRGGNGLHTHGAVYGYASDGDLVWSEVGGPDEYLGKWIDTADLDDLGGVDLMVGGARPANQDNHPLGGVARVWLLGTGGHLESPSDRFDLPHPEPAYGTGATNRNFGYRIQAGDVTGDGTADIIVTDPYVDETVGAAYLYRGPVVRGDLPEWILRGNPALAEDPKFGRGIAFGDVDADGTDDFAIGAPSRAIWSDVARVYVFFGGAIEDLPGDGTLPRIAVAPASDRELAPPGWGNMGEYVIMAPLQGSPDGPWEIASSILASGRNETLGVYVFSVERR